jgi:hypothetical protein
VAEQDSHYSNFDHWRDFVAAHPWPIAIAVLSLLWLLVLIPWPTTPDSQTNLVETIESPIDEITLDAARPQDLPGQPVITARKIRVTGHVLLTSPAVLIANEIEFAPNSRVWAPSGEITVIAPHIVHGVFDVSGANGRDGRGAGTAGRDGETGGSIYIATADPTDSVVEANGGNGGNGQRGYAGANGRPGYCGPRGFGLAERGRVGGDGGDAGNGGSGGVVTIWYSTAQPRVVANEGQPGIAARGGPGGRGGAGCKGVRGKQPAQSAGNEGAAGRVGSGGSKGVISTRRVDFNEVARAYEAWSKQPATIAALRDRLSGLPIVEVAER